MPVKRNELKTIVVRVLGTVVLAVGFLFFVATAPFMPQSEDIVIPPEPVAVVDRPPANLTMPPPGYSRGASGLSGPPTLQPMLGLFEAEFAQVDDQLGFSTSEHKVAGECNNAGRRFLEQECPGCGLLGDSPETEMLMWQQTSNGAKVVRSVSRHCMRVTPDGHSIVGTLEFGDGKVNLIDDGPDRDPSQVPLISGAVRLASVRVGLWSATYDKVPRPASALQDMTNALELRGWREVSESEHIPEDAFGGQRVFTNDGSAVCVISLIRQGQDYQLTTIISLRA